MAATDDKKIIFSMVGVSKTIQQNQKQILKNIYLSFFYGAKIGIIGLNGAGKSTLMKIIAGIEKQYQGEVVFSPGYSVGYLPQDPYLDPEKTVNSVTREERLSFVNLIKNVPMTITGTRGFNEAIITRGGVSVKEINPKTMESKLINGLYFAGEMIDVDAHTGGYNLQIAWSTGYLAGSGIAFT